MRLFLRRARYAIIALSALGVSVACSTKVDDAPSKYPCLKDTDCTVYGKTGQCANGTCIGAGLLCADRAQLDGRAPSAGPGSASVAVTFEEMIFTAQSLYGTFCEQLSACHGGGSPGSCEESAPDPESTSCCKGMLDFYVLHRSEIMACSSASLPCSTQQLSDFCGPLATLFDPGCDKG